MSRQLASAILPNFVVIGAGRSGTTSLYSWFASHPQVFVPSIKETNYFAYAALLDSSRSPAQLGAQNRFPVRSWSHYEGLFDGARSFCARGEVSPMYMALPGVPEKIYERLSNVRIIAVLRNPVDRAYSSYLMHRRDGLERRTFGKAVREEIDGSYDRPLAYGQRHYLHIGFYDQHLARYMTCFNEAQLHIEIFDDLVTDAAAVYRRICSFLEVDDTFVPDVSARFNASGIPSNRLFAPFVRKNRATRILRFALPAKVRRRIEPAFERWRARHLVKPTLDRSLRAALSDRFREDIRRLEERLGRDLSKWLRE